MITIKQIKDTTRTKKFKRKDIEKNHPKKKEPKNPMLPPVDLNSRFRQFKSLSLHALFLLIDLF